MLEDCSQLDKFFLYRPPRLKFDRQFVSVDWCRPIDHLMAARYSFKAENFSEPAYLFRGMKCGLMEALERKECGYFAGESETDIAEQIMQIYFVTHELSDALTASSIFNGKQGGAILVFNSALFNQALQRGTAAIMEVGDMGVLFRYPFLTQPLLLSDLTGIIVHQDTAQAIEQRYPQFTKLIHKVASGAQHNTLAEAKSILTRMGWEAAMPCSCNIYPSYKKYLSS